MESWRLVLLLFLLFSLVLLAALEEWYSWPSCETTEAAAATAATSSGGAEVEDDLRVMMVADLLLLAPEDAGISQLYFRDPYTAKFLKKSFQKLKPDMLVVLGDLSANGSHITNGKWIRLLKQFQKMLGPFTGYPIHIVLGDRDTGDCKTMDLHSIRRISKNFPGLDSTGCGAFEIANVSFVSLNSIAMLCEDSETRFNVETTIERESLDLQTKENFGTGYFKGPHNVPSSLGKFMWRDNFASSGSGPVLLLHLPLCLTAQGDWRQMQTIGNSPETQEASWKLNFGSHNVGSGPYELTSNLPMNVTEYIFQALRPRIVFSAHSHHFLDRIHGDGTREVTVPAMSWAARDDPGFVIAIFGRNGSIDVRRCFLARESKILLVHSCNLLILLATSFTMTRSCFLFGRPIS